ncbi:MAG: hypothetical protein RL226_1675 [Bacteroidota bacterium]
MIRFIFKNAALYTIANQIPMFANLLLLPIISTYLTKEDYYVFGTVLAYGSVISVMSNFGLIPSLQNAFFKERENFSKRYGDLMYFLLRYRIVYTVVLALVILVFFRDELPLPRLLLIIFLYSFPMMFLELYKTVGMRYYMFNQRHGEVHSITVISGILTVVTTFVTVYVLELHYVGWFISLFVGNTFQGLYFRYKLKVKEQLLAAHSPDKDYLKACIKFGLPTIPHNYSSYLLNTADRLVLDQYKGVGSVSTGDIGLYNVAYGFASYFDNLNGQVNNVVSPIYFNLFAKADSNANHVVRNLTFVWLTLNLALAFVLALWSKEIFSLLYFNNTDGLADAYKYSVFLFMAFVYKPMYVAAVDRAIFNERTMSLLKISFAAGVLNVVLNIALVPFFGVQAAILATFVAYMYQGFSGHYFKDFKRFSPLNYYPTLLLLLITALSVSAYFLCETSVLVKAIITLTVGLLLVVIYLVWGKTVLKQLNSTRIHGQ